MPEPSAVDQRALFDLRDVFIPGGVGPNYSSVLSARELPADSIAPPCSPPTVQIIHSGHACNIEEESYTERIYNIHEGETLELTCLVSGHPRPQCRLLEECLDSDKTHKNVQQPAKEEMEEGERCNPGTSEPKPQDSGHLPVSYPVLSPQHVVEKQESHLEVLLEIRWTKTVGSATDRFQDSSVFNETLRISHIQRHQGGRYYCKAENGLGTPAIKSIRVDVYYLDDPIVTVHQSIGEAKEQFYYERTVFLRCAANSNPPVRYSWKRGREFLYQGSDKGVEIYEPFFTQGETKILKLKNLRPQDYANYTCTASVRSVCGIPDKSVVFQLSNKTASPTIKLLVEDPIVANPGQTVTLVCIISGGEPNPSLSWVRNTEELPKKSVLNGGTLTIPAISTEDAGVYSCVASNNVGNPAKKSTNILVRGPGFNANPFSVCQLTGSGEESEITHFYVRLQGTMGVRCLAREEDHLGEVGSLRGRGS
ncbi:hypothetical protein DNTS_016338 [Danionella cerebrum]|uniref:Ig-like domain-containing protein n=1 Tax=Danionella cerebrum TaxID=2873325 RepID=A0A553QZA0_9TELE|nr:hypothetical protein DNTS_016338 [Danionella translucida]